jgi:hypothetical protein
MRFLAVALLLIALSACDAVGTSLAGTLRLASLNAMSLPVGSASEAAWPLDVVPVELVGTPTRAYDGTSSAAPFISCYAGACRFAHMTLHDVTVPQGASWRLEHVEITGSLVVAPGARLDALAITVHGDVRADRAADVVLSGSDVLGDLVIQRGGRVDVRTSTVGGATLVAANTGRVWLEGNVFATPPRTTANIAGQSLRDNVVLRGPA